MNYKVYYVPQGVALNHENVRTKFIHLSGFCLSSAYLRLKLSHILAESNEIYLRHEVSIS